jgi:heptosyltransferase-2
MQKRSVAEIRKLVSERKMETRRVPPGAHQIHEYLHLVAALGANPAPVPPLIEIRTHEEKQVAERFGLDVRASEAILGLNAGAEYGPAKRWPLDRFIACVVEVQRRITCRWIIFGGPNEKMLGEEIAKQLADKTHVPGNKPGEVLNLAGQTSLRELCVLLKMCRALLTNDSGPMHVAAAVGTPVVVPFGSTSSDLTGPGLPGDPVHRILRAEVPCSPCFLRVCPIDLRCLTGISVDQVAEAVLAAAK